MIPCMQYMQDGKEKITTFKLNSFIIPTDDLLWSVFIKELLFIGYIPPRYFFFYFSAGEFRTGQKPMSHIISLSKQVCLGELKTERIR